MTPAERLIVALDVDDRVAAGRLVDRLGDRVSIYKIGYQLVFGGGLDLTRDLVAAGKRVFLDMKLHDIANTVEQGAARVAALGVSWLTVHAYPQTVRAAVAGAAGSPLRVLGVTVLTSWDETDIAASGYAGTAADLVRRRAGQCAQAGAHGLILSPMEVADVRAGLPRAMELITPGIRPCDSAAGDQKRVATPAGALRAGADRLVVGRPITAAPDPVAAAEAILAEIAAA